jgi:hypothetical protein
MGYITEYPLTDREGGEWTFRVFGNTDSTVLVRIRHHPKMRGSHSLTLVHCVTFSNDLLKQLPKAIIEEEFARARLFQNRYSWVRDFSDSDYARNATVIGIRMEFSVPYYTVELEREDARRLWRHLKRI